MWQEEREERACPHLAFASYHERVGAQKGFWIPAAARMTDGFVKATREDENSLFIVMTGEWPGEYHSSSALVKSASASPPISQCDSLAPVTNLAFAGDYTLI